MTCTIDNLFERDLLSFDIESSGTHVRKDVPFGFTIAADEDKSFWVNADDHYYTQLLNNPDTTYLTHNGKFDRSMAKKLGITIDNICDTMIAAHLLEEPYLNLKDLIMANTGMDMREFTDLDRHMLLMNDNELYNHFEQHARAPLILWNGHKESGWQGYAQELKRNILWDVFWDVEMPLIPVLSDMETNGVMIDKPYLSELEGYFDSRLENLEYALKGWKDLNYNSPEQVAPFFYDELGITPYWRKTSKGRPSLDGKYLEEHKDEHPIIPIYLMYKQLQKLKGTYVDALLRDMIDSRIYGNFKQTGTRTSRLSSTDPNLQNIPARSDEGRKIRKAFRAPEGKKLIKCDADQLELKCMAIRSKDRAMLNAFKENKDIHTETAIRAFGSAGERRRAKTLNFQIQYGGGEKADQDAWYKAYPGVKKWKDSFIIDVKSNGYVRTLCGRKRTLPDIQLGNKVIVEPKSYTGRLIAHAEREAISTAIQGTGSEIVKLGMAKIWNDTRDSDFKIVLQVHDEVVYEVPAKVADEFALHIAQTMQYNDLDIPITYSTSVGDNWAEMKEVVKSGKMINK
jgi:DNA polymerase-1